MNREQRRAFVKKAQKRGMTKKDASNLLRIADTSGNVHNPPQEINTGDKVTLKVPDIMAKKNYGIMNPAYREFVEQSESVVYTAVREGTKLIHLKEAPRWLFWCGDLSVVEAESGNSPSQEEIHE